MKRIVLALSFLALTAAGGAELHAQRNPEAAARLERGSRGWIGLAYVPEDEDCQPCEGDAAIVVRDVEPGSPADRAGLRGGNVIVRWNGRRDVLAAVVGGHLAPGDTLRLTVLDRPGARAREVTLVAAARARGVRVASPDERAIEIIRRPSGDVVVVRPEVARASVEAAAHALALQADSMHRRLQVVLADSLARHFRELRASVDTVRIRAEMREALRSMAMAQEALVEARPAIVSTFDFGARSVAGAEFAEVNTGLASYFGTDHGALVLRVSPETPAARAGLRAGDVVTTANGFTIDEVSDLRTAVTRARDREVRLEVIRRGEPRTMTMRWE